jgi:hypothetical protein
MLSLPIGEGAEFIGRWTERG